MIKKVKETVQWKYFISDLNSEDTGGKFYEKELKNRSKRV